MNKHYFIATLALSTILSVAMSLPVHADDTVNGVIDLPDDTSADTTTNINSNDNTDDNTAAENNSDTVNGDDFETIIWTDGEIDQEAINNVRENTIIIDPSAETEDEELSDPEIWPLVVSLIALSCTVVIVFTLNIRSKKQK